MLLSDGADSFRVGEGRTDWDQERNGFSGELFRVQLRRPVHPEERAVEDRRTDGDDRMTLTRIHSHRPLSLETKSDGRLIAFDNGLESSLLAAAAEILAPPTLSWGLGPTTGH